MQMYNDSGLRKSLEQLETEQLDKMLQAELEKQDPDMDAVRLIVRVLEERDGAVSATLPAGSQAAFQRYRDRMKGLQRHSAPVRHWIAVAASMVLILGMLFAVVPQQVEAESFWEMLQRWSGTVMEFFSKQDRFKDPVYIFETDNPGLQQVYDAVVELGVTDPMVPMWLPEECELISLELIQTPMIEGICARFSYNQSELVYKLDVYAEKPARQFYRDDSHYESYEKNGTSFNITRNNNRWGAVWMKDNIECSIILDCQEDTLRRILGSIYVMEDD